MAHHGPSYGLDADIKAKESLKIDPQAMTGARQWVERVTGESVGEDFQAGLKDGVILCKLANKLRPGSVPNISPSKMPFKQMENIGFFLKTCESFGMKKEDLFMTVDLYEGKHLSVVVDTILRLRDRSPEAFK